MATNDLLQAEARERPRVAIVAGLAAVLTIAAPLIVRLAVGGDSPDNALGSALVQSEHRVAVLIGAASSVLGLLAITYVVDFLLRATRARNAQVQSFIRPLLIAGGIALALFSGILQIVTAIRIHHFATESTLTWQELKDASSYGPFVFVGIAAQFAFAIGLILVSLNAMRVGLVTRFLGYLGVFSAVLFVIAILPLPIVQVYWLAMLGLLFWGFRSSREPPAWSSGREEPWPSAAEMREQRVRAAEERRGGGGAAEPAAEIDAGAADGDDADDEQDAGGSGTATSRRKRKKRRWRRRSAGAPPR